MITPLIQYTGNYTAAEIQITEKPNQPDQLFTLSSSGTLTLLAPMKLSQFLAIGAGGSVSYGSSGGGAGAGGVVTAEEVELPAGSYDVVIGTPNSNFGGRAGDTSITFTNTSTGQTLTITAFGGGNANQAEAQQGNVGGNGAGSSQGSHTIPGGATIQTSFDLATIGLEGIFTGHGFSGGSNKGEAGGGGGGAGSPGGDAIADDGTPADWGGSPGSGLNSSITGSSLTYAIGGGGGSELKGKGADGGRANNNYGTAGNATSGHAAESKMGGVGVQGVIFLRFVNPANNPGFLSAG